VAIAFGSGSKPLEQVTVLFRSRQGGDDLARALGAIRRVGLESKDLLATDDGKRSPDTLAIAREMKVWPEAGAAPDLAFLTAFDALYKKFGKAAFPAVEVIARPFMLSVPSSAFKAALPRGVALFNSNDDIAAPGKALICDSRYTFLADTECRVTVVPTGFGSDPTLRTLQMGYTLTLVKPVDSSVAEKVEAEIRRAVAEGRRGVEAPLSEVATIRVPMRPEQAQPPSGAEMKTRGVSAPVPRGQAVSQQQVSPVVSALPATTSNSNLDELAPYREIAKALGLPAGQLLPAIATNAQTWSAAPKIFIFDGVKPLPNPQSLDSWGMARASAIRPDFLAKCPPLKGSNDPRQHMEAVASLLFPPNVNADDNPDVLGQFAPADEMLTAAPIRDSVLSEQDRGAIILAPFGQPFSPVNSTIQGFIETNLRDNAVLIVSAALLKDVDQGKNFSYIGNGREGCTVDNGAIASACAVTPWPACLGNHPRVVVVASTLSPGGQSPAQLDNYADGDRLYALGMSHVRLAAPGKGVHVVFRKGMGDDPDSWVSAGCDGSSFAAPLVALLVGHITQRQFNAGLQGGTIDPYFAVMRLIATGEPLEDNRTEAEAFKPARLVGFGRVDARLALSGISKDLVGENGRATIHQAGQAPRYAVVAAYPWADVALGDGFKGLNDDGDVARGRFGTYMIGQNGVETRGQLSVKKLIRIRRTNDNPNDPVFDAYYIDAIPGSAVPGSPPMQGVFVRKGVKFGANGDSGVNPCNPNGLPVAGKFPACLYEWSGAPGEMFRPLDLSAITDIVFPPFHNRLQRLRVSGTFADLRKPESSVKSPWREALCNGTRLQPSALAAWARLSVPPREDDLKKKISQLCEKPL
jgi:hypothetical protein